MTPASINSRGTITYEPRFSLATITRALRFGCPDSVTMPPLERAYVSSAAKLVASVKESIEEVLPCGSPRRAEGGAKYFLYDRCDGDCVELDLCGGVAPFWHTSAKPQEKKQRADDLRPTTRIWSQSSAGFVALHDNSLPVTVLAFDKEAWIACKQMSRPLDVDAVKPPLPDNELAQQLVRNLMKTSGIPKGKWDFGTPRMSSVVVLLRSMMRRNCMVCGTASPLKCQGCKVVGFCSVECQKKGWKVHKDTCALLAQSNLGETGRTLVMHASDAL